MAFPTNQTLAGRLQQMASTANQLQGFLGPFKATLAAGNVSASQFPNLANILTASLVSLNDNSAAFDTAPKRQLAQDLAGDVSFDIVADFDAMRDALVALQTIVLNSRGSWLVDPAFDTAGTLQWNDFTPAQTQTARDAIDAFLATV